MADADRDVEAEIAAFTDQYFKRTRTAVQRYGDVRVTYAVFMDFLCRLD